MDSTNAFFEGRSTHETLLRICLAINDRLDLPAILTQIVHNTSMFVGCKHASIVLWNSRKRRFEKGTSTTDVGDLVAHRVRPKGGATRWILDHRQPVVVSDVLHDPFTANPMIPETGIGSYVGVPIQKGNEILGVLYALSQRMRPFDQGEVAKMQNMAGVSAIAIRNGKVMNSLREINDFKDAMIRLAAHDLREPLGLADGFLDVMVQNLDPLPPEQLKRLDIIRRAHIRMEAIIAGILEYERLSEENEIVRFSVNLNDLVEEASSNFEATAAQKSQRLTVELSPKPLIVQGDAMLLLEAVNNLISNAIKYTPPGGQITIQTEENDAGILVSIKDTGIGIDPREREKLFRPFVRLNSAASEKGTGLGLSLVKLVVERHGGHVSVESFLGKGSVFQIHLPKAKQIV